MDVPIVVVVTGGGPELRAGRLCSWRHFGRVAAVAAALEDLMSGGSFDLYDARGRERLCAEALGSRVARVGGPLRLLVELNLAAADATRALTAAERACIEAMIPAEHHLRVAVNGPVPAVAGAVLQTAGTPELLVYHPLIYAPALLVAKRWIDKRTFGRLEHLRISALAAETMDAAYSALTLAGFLVDVGRPVSHVALDSQEAGDGDEPCPPRLVYRSASQGGAVAADVEVVRDSRTVSDVDPTVMYCRLFFERARVVINFDGEGSSAMHIAETDGVRMPAGLPEGDGLYYAMLDAVECARQGRVSGILSGDAAARRWAEIVRACLPAAGE